MTAITARLRQWHPPHCAGPDSCDCGHEEAAAEIERLMAVISVTHEHLSTNWDDDMKDEAVQHTIDLLAASRTRP